MPHASRTAVAGAERGGDVLRVFTKTPDEVLDFAIDFTAALDSGDSISGAATWTVPSGITQGAVSVSGATAISFFSGGTAGGAYVVQCRVTTTPGARQLERAITIQVRDP